MSERDLQRASIDYMEQFGWVVTRVNSSGYRGRIRGAKKGTSDALACSPAGRFVAIEFKDGDEAVTKEQMEFMRRVARAGGEWQVIRSMDDVRGLVGRMRR